jgi:hypothetical protein
MGACSSSACEETLTCAADVADASGDAVIVEGGRDETDVVDAADGMARDGAADVGFEAGDGPDVAPDGPTTACVRSGAVCTPAIPPGFQGPAILELSTSDAGAAPPAPSCASPYPVDALEAYGRPIALPATCGCACGPVTGGCSSPAVETYTDNTCVNECNQVLAGACTLDACSSSAQSARITGSSQPAGGGCTASLQRTVPQWDAAADWGALARVCATTGASIDGGCQAPQLCVPPAPTGAAICVWQQADVPCPAGYPEKALLYTSGSDGRDCASACTCDAPTGVTCSAIITVSSAATCGAGTLLVAGSCNAFASTASPYVSATVTPSGGACVADGGAKPTGAVTPSGPVTVCCAG